jgi:hypothetical protein
MNYRKLRIAWSVGWGVLCLLLIALWVRSYRCGDWLEIPLGMGYSVQAATGVGTIYFNVAPAINSGWSYGADPEQPEIINYYHGRNERWINRQPIWLVSVFAAAVGVVPWLRWRFSLRTLLIATTVVAVAIGLAVMTLRAE